MCIYSLYVKDKHVEWERRKMDNSEDEGLSPMDGVSKNRRKRTKSRKYKVGHSPFNGKLKNLTKEKGEAEEEDKAKYACDKCNKHYSFVCNYKFHLQNKCKEPTNGEVTSCQSTWHHWKYHVEPEEQKCRESYEMKSLVVKLQRLKSFEKTKPEKSHIFEGKKEDNIGMNNNVEGLFGKIPKLEEIMRTEDPLLLEETICCETLAISNAEYQVTLPVVLDSFQDLEVTDEHMEYILDINLPFQDSNSVNQDQISDLEMHVNNEIITDKVEEIEDENTKKFEEKKNFIAIQLLKLAKEMKDSDCSYPDLEEILNNYDLHKRLHPKVACKNLWVFDCEQKLVDPPSLTTINNTLNYDQREYKFHFILYGESNLVVPDAMKDIIEVLEGILSETWKILDEQNIVFNGDFVTFAMQRNRKEEVIALIRVEVTNNAIKKCLEQQLERRNFNWNLVAFYYTTPISEPTLIYGDNYEIEEQVGHLYTTINTKNLSELNVCSIEMLAENVGEYLQLDPSTTLLEIGCETGLIGLLLSDKCKRVVGVGDMKEITAAQLTRGRNAIENSFYVCDSIYHMERMFEGDINYCENVVAFLNQGSDCAISNLTMNSLRGVPNLKRIVILTMLDINSFPSLMTLMVQGPKWKTPSFTPKVFVTLDINHFHDHAYCLIVMER